MTLLITAENLKTGEFRLIDHMAHRGKINQAEASLIEDQYYTEHSTDFHTFEICIIRRLGQAKGCFL